MACLRSHLRLRAPPSFQTLSRMILTLRWILKSALDKERDQQIRSNLESKFLPSFDEKRTARSTESTVSY